MLALRHWNLIMAGSPLELFILLLLHPAGRINNSQLRSTKGNTQQKHAYELMYREREKCSLEVRSCNTQREEYFPRASSLRLIMVTPWEDGPHQPPGERVSMLHPGHMSKNKALGLPATTRLGQPQEQGPPSTV